MTEGTPPAGHNNPPQFIDQSTLDKVAELVDGAERMIKALPEITNQADEAKVVDFMNGQLRPLLSRLEDERKSAKRPLDQKVKALQAEFNDPKRLLEASIDACKRLLGPWLEKKRKAAEEERRKQEEKARKAAEEAAAAAKAAQESGGLRAQLEADQAAERAKEAEKAAQAKTATTARGQLSSGRAVSLRTYYHGKLVDSSKALRHYIKRSDARLIEALQTMVDADIRGNPDLKSGKASIPGVEVISDERAA